MIVFLVNNSSSCSKIIIKIGTNAIINNKEIFDILAKDISQLIKREKEIIIVTSGAIGHGKQIIGNRLGAKQAQAAIGQTILMQKYSKAFQKYNLNVAQFLLTLEDLQNKKRINNIKQTYRFLKNKAITIVNENDTTSTQEITFGDNDILASQLLIKLDFDLLILLTKKGVLIKNSKEVKITTDFNENNYDKIKVSSGGSGGLKSKLQAAKTIVNAGKKCIIAKSGDSILDILNKKTKITEFYKSLNKQKEI